MELQASMLAYDNVRSVPLATMPIEAVAVSATYDVGHSIVSEVKRSVRQLRAAVRKAARERRKAQREAGKTRSTVALVTTATKLMDDGSGMYTVADVQLVRVSERNRWREQRVKTGIKPVMRNKGTGAGRLPEPEKPPVYGMPQLSRAAAELNSVKQSEHLAWIARKAHKRALYVASLTASHGTAVIGGDGYDRHIPYQRSV